MAISRTNDPLSPAKNQSLFCFMSVHIEVILDKTCEEAVQDGTIWRGLINSGASAFEDHESSEATQQHQQQIQ